MVGPLERAEKAGDEDSVAVDPRQMRAERLLYESTTRATLRLFLGIGDDQVCAGGPPKTAHA